MLESTCAVLWLLLVSYQLKLEVSSYTAKGKKSSYVRESAGSQGITNKRNNLIQSLISKLCLKLLEKDKQINVCFNS